MQGDLNSRVRSEVASLADGLATLGLAFDHEVNGGDLVSLLARHAAPVRKLLRQAHAHSDALDENLRIALGQVFTGLVELGFYSWPQTDVNGGDATERFGQVYAEISEFLRAAGAPPHVFFSASRGQFYTGRGGLQGNWDQLEDAMVLHGATGERAAAAIEAARRECPDVAVMPLEEARQLQERAELAASDDAGGDRPRC